MEDTDIVRLFWDRDEQAIRACEEKYGGLCFQLAMRLLQNREDAEECVNDTFHEAWREIPPARPNRLSAWLGRIVRCQAINRWNREHAQKRDAGITDLLQELEDCIPATRDVESEIEDAELGRILSRWLRTLTKDDRILFVRRYWDGIPLQDLAAERGVPAGRLAQKMHRLRGSLRKTLKQEGIFV